MGLAPVPLFFVSRRRPEVFSIGSEIVMGKEPLAPRRSQPSPQTPETTRGHPERNNGPAVRSLCDTIARARGAFSSHLDTIPAASSR